MIENINKEEAKSLIEQNQKLINSSDIDFESEEKFNALQERRGNGILAIKERNDVIKMRRFWSYSLLITILTIVFFDILIVFLIGFKFMIFEEGYIVPFFIGESLIKTLGLTVIVVRYLFNTKDSQGKDEFKK